MIYFEFNHKGGKGKYSQMTETAYQQAIQQNDRWFLIFAEDGYALECTQAEHRDYYSRLNHEKNSRRGKDGKYPELLSIERNEVECSSDMSVFFDGDNLTIDDIVLDKLEIEERNALVHKAVDQLTSEEQYMLQELVFRKRTQTDLAEEFHITQQALSKRYRAVLKKLSDFLKNCM